MKDKEIQQKKVFLRTFGCQMNVRDSEVVSGVLKTAGYVLVDALESADIVIFNTCSVRQHAEDKVWSEIGTISKRSTLNAKRFTGKIKPIIGIIGCMAQNYREQIFERSPAVDFVVGPSDIGKIAEIVKKIASSQAPRNDTKKIGAAVKNGAFGESASFFTSARSRHNFVKQNYDGRALHEMKIWETDGQIRPEDIYHTGFYEDKEHSYVVISEGCSNFCSYCVVPYVRGRLHHRAYQDILKEIEQAVAQGITKITLLGQNVNAYKSTSAQDARAQVSFIDLLKMVDDITGLKEFSFVTSHPRDTSVELFKAMAGCEKLKKNLHLPVQSGSDKILESMNRGYSRKFYLDLVENYRKIVKGGGLTTDIIVGFCGESENDFNDTYELIKTVEFDAAYIFKYSLRPNTAALKWPDDVPKSEKESRHAKILELQREISRGKRSKK